MKTLKYDTIVFEGIDRSGKSHMLSVVSKLDRKYFLQCRGLISNLAYSKIFKRPQDFKYNLTNYSNVVFVLLNVDYDDWKIRCELTNESSIDYFAHVSAFNSIASDLDKAGIMVLTYNTSELSTISIAKSIVSTLDALNSINDY